MINKTKFNDKNLFFWRTDQNKSMRLNLNFYNR